MFNSPVVEVLKVIGKNKVEFKQETTEYFEPEILNKESVEKEKFVDTLTILKCRSKTRNAIARKLGYTNFLDLRITYNKLGVNVGHTVSSILVAYDKNFKDFVSAVHGGNPTKFYTMLELLFSSKLHISNVLNSDGTIYLFNEQLFTRIEILY